MPSICLVYGFRVALGRFGRQGPASGLSWRRVLHFAFGIGPGHTIKEGYRSFDLLHVATALHLATKEFLTFDDKQRKLAAAAGLAVKL
jgi:hypothetical protein